MRFQVSNTPLIFHQYNVASLVAINGKTRDRRDRDFAINIASGQLNDYGIEEEIVFSGFAKEYSNRTTQVQYSFNPPVAPRLTNLDPHHGEIQVLPRSDLYLRVRDDWSGIDPNSLVVTIKH
ncbi:MAG: hypothetical protein GXP45_07360 [bacterium]|nr:hypothetical protein [bacterium]